MRARQPDAGIDPTWRAPPYARTTVTSAPERVVAIALPAVMLDVTFLADCRTPTLFVHGDRDQFSPAAQFEALLARCPGETQVVRIPGADHFLYAYADRVGEHAVRFVTGS